VLRGLFFAEQLIRGVGILSAILAGLFARPFPPEHETDPANPALAGRQKPYRWGAYLAVLLLASALVMCVDVWIYVLESKPVWALASFAGATLSLAGSIDLFRRSWRGVFLFTAWCLFLFVYSTLTIRAEAGSAPWLLSGFLTAATIWISLVYFGRRKALMQRVP
jgi:hypothetical protein